MRPNRRPSPKKPAGKKKKKQSMTGRILKGERTTQRGIERGAKREKGVSSGFRWRGGW